MLIKFNFNSTNNFVISSSHNLFANIITSVFKIFLWYQSIYRIVDDFAPRSPVSPKLKTFERRRSKPKIKKVSVNNKYLFRGTFLFTLKKKIIVVVAMSTFKLL